VSNDGSVTSGTVTSCTNDRTTASGGSTIAASDTSDFLVLAGSYHGLVAGGNAWPAANGWPSNTLCSFEFTSGTTIGASPDASVFNHPLFTNYVAAMPDSKPLGASIVTLNNQGGSVTAHDNITAPFTNHHHG
jgi:hypothetical protein